MSAGRRKSGSRQTQTAGPAAEGASALDRARLLFNDSHCLSVFQLLSNAIQPYLHHRPAVLGDNDSVREIKFKSLPFNNKVPL